MDRKKEIVYKDVNELIPYENNARINDKAVDVVANSIKEFNFQQPILIDKNNVIIAGHTRQKAAQKPGITKVPCIVADDLTEEQIKAFRIADNSSAQVAEWDMDKLMKELETIDYDMSEFGLAEQIAEIEKVIDKDAEEDNFEIDEEVEPRVKVGEIWQLGRHRLMCGDSTKQEDVYKLMNGNLADIVVTDPPYNVAIVGGSHALSPEERIKRGGKTILNDKMGKDEFLQFLTNAFANISTYLKDGGAFYIWYASAEHINFEQALINNDLYVKEQLIWNKSSFTFGRADYHWKHEPCLYGWKEGAAHYFIDDRTQSTVIEDACIDLKKLKKEEMLKMLQDIFSDKVSTTIINEEKPTKCDLHPTMKPVKLIARLIKNSSRKGENVLDLFGGSGTTLVASEQLDRNCFIMEFDPKYATAIVDRYEKLTGKKAEKLN